MQGDDPYTPPEPPIWRKAAWFIGLWVGGVTAVAVVAGILRTWLH